MALKDDFAELPLLLQVVLKGFGVGCVIGLCFASAMMVQYLMTPERYQSEVLWTGAGLYLLVIGFPTSLVAYPVFYLAPWVVMILLPAVNCGLLALGGYGIYRLVGGLPYLRDL